MIPHVGPDALRKLAKSFADEDCLVKNQVRSRSGPLQCSAALYVVECRRARAIGLYLPMGTACALQEGVLMFGLLLLGAQPRRQAVPQKPRADAALVRVRYATLSLPAALFEEAVSEELFGAWRCGAAVR